MTRLFEKHASSQEAVTIACRAVVYYSTSLPSLPPLTIKPLVRSAFSALSLHVQSKRLAVIEPGMKLLVTLFRLYPIQLWDVFSMFQLASIMVAGIEPDTHVDKQVKIQIGLDCASIINDAQRLAESDKEILVREGVCYALSSLVASYQDDMTPQSIKEVAIAVTLLSSFSPSGALFINENFYTSLLFAAQEHASDSALQQVIWKVLMLRCQSDTDFVVHLMSMDVLSVVVGVLERVGVSKVADTFLLKFLTICCHRLPGSFIPLCLERPALVQYMLGIIETEECVTETSLIADVCDFLAFLYTKCHPSSYHHLAKLNLVTKLQACAKRLPIECLLPACMVMEAALIHHTVDDTVLSTCPEFVKDLLLNSQIYSNADLLNMTYLLLQKILKHFPPELFAKLWERDFVMLFVLSFIRDVYAHPSHAKVFGFTAHYFVFQAKKKEPVELLREFEFHNTVTELITLTTNFEALITFMGLMASLMNKYHEFFKDLKPFLDAQLPVALLEKMKLNAHRCHTQFSDDFSRILLNITADKENSLALFSQGYLDKLLSLLHDAEHYNVVVTRAILHGIGNLALGGVHIKKLLLEQKIDLHLVQMLRTKAKTGDAPLLSACCRVLHILASGDLAKRNLVEHGCLEVLLELVRTRKDSVEIQWRPLGLLSSIGFMAMVNRRYVLTPEVIEAVANILQESNNGKVVSYTMLVFLAAGELDSGLLKLRQPNLEEAISAAVENADYVKLSSEVARWGTSILEKLCLFTVMAQPNMFLSLPQPAACSAHDWPPVVNISVSPPRFQLHLSAASASRQLLLPLEDAYMQPHFPTAVELTDAAREQLSQLGLDLSEPLFRIGRVYGSTFGLCINCEKDEASEELVIRPHSMTPAQYQELIDHGWYRRGGIKLFRLRRNHTVHCCDWETRVLVHEFDHRTHKSYKKVLRRMPTERVTVETLPTHFSRAAFDLYNEYHVDRHDKPLKSEYSYCEHIVNSPLVNCSENGVNYGTYHQLYRLDGKLAAIGIIDIVPSGIVSVYMWYSTAKEVCRLSFGVYSALKEIELVRELSKKNPGMRYYYLQGWNEHNKKLSYKANYAPEEFYSPCITQGWVSSLEEVQREQERILAKAGQTRVGERKDGTEKEGVAGSGESSDNCDPSSQGGTTGEGKKREQGSSDASGTTTLSTSVQQAAVSNSASVVSSPNKQPPEKVDEITGNAAPVVCTAFPNDLERYREQTGLDSVNLDYIVVCMNFSHYIHFGEISKHYNISPRQHQIMSDRFKELVAAIGPKLTSQLVIDLKACPGPSSSPLAKSSCSSSAVSHGPMLAEM